MTFIKTALKSKFKLFRMFAYDIILTDVCQQGQGYFGLARIYRVARSLFVDFDNLCMPR
jgi:hypothetical protein